MEKNISVVFDLRLFHLFHLISVGYRRKMEKSIANGSSGSTSSTPIWLSQLSANLNLSFPTDLQVLTENHSKLRAVIAS